MHTQAQRELDFFLSYSYYIERVDHSDNEFSMDKTSFFYVTIIPDKYTFVKARGEILKSIYVSGYRSFELSIFDEKDEKLFFLKEFLKDRMKAYIENGVEWFVINGQLGIELWTGEVILQLQEEFPEAHLAVLLPYTGYGEKWNETNKGLLERVIHQADYVNYTSNKEYESPKQLNGNQIFSIRNTDGAFLVYDTINEVAADGSPKYIYNLIERYQENNMYALNTVSFEEIEFFIHEYIESNPDIMDNSSNSQP